MTSLTRQRDTDYLVTQSLNDKDLLALCMADPNLAICKVDNFWKQRFLNKYGPIDKSKAKSWKTVYLQLVYYNDKGKTVNERMNLAARGGHSDLVELFISKGATDWNLGMNSAARGGHRELVELFISKGATNWNLGMNSAAFGGHRDLVDFFITKGAWYWKSGMIYAARGGHRDLVDFFISKGANNWNMGMYGAARGGHHDLVDFFKEKMC